MSILALFCTFLLFTPTLSTYPKHVAPPDFVHHLLASAKQLSVRSARPSTLSKPFSTSSSASHGHNDHDDVLSHLSSVIHNRAGRRGDGTPMPDMTPDASPEDMIPDDGHADHYYTKKKLKKRLYGMIEPYGEKDAYYRRKGKCPPRTMSPDHASGVTTDYTGPYDEVSYFDPHYGFLRYGMGFSMQQVNESKYVALKHFKMQFGIDFDLERAEHYEDIGVYHDKQSDIYFSSYIATPVSRVVLDSYWPLECADVTSVSGGWIMSSLNGMKIHGKHGGEKGLMYKGEVHLSNFFSVTLHATRMSTRAAFYTMMPTSCDLDGYCPVSGVTYNFDDDVMGWMDGIGMYKMVDTEKNIMSYTFRGVVMSPGRFAPMKKDEEKKEKYEEMKDKNKAKYEAYMDMKDTDIN